MKPLLDIETRPLRRPEVLLVGLAVLLARANVASPQAGTSVDLRSETIRQLQAQPVGKYTLEVMNLPERFLGRVADRVIQMSFQNMHRSVAGQSDPRGSRLSASESEGARNSSATAPPAKPGPWSTRVVAAVAAALALAVAVVVARRLRCSTDMAGGQP